MTQNFKRSQFHGWTSNHSQDWLLALLWIISLTLGASSISVLNYYLNNAFEKCLIGFMIMALIFLLNINFVKWRKSTSLVIISILTITYVLTTKDYSLSIFSNLVNPFSIMTKGETLTFGVLLFKSIIAYLLYQFIVSLRQNTRRK